MRKVILFICLLVISIFPVVNSNAETLADMKKGLDGLKAKKNAAETKTAQTKSEINSAKNNIYNSQEQIKKNQKSIDDAKVEIESLNVEISKTEESIKTLMNSIQVTYGDNIYLEYVFNSESYADLVYRYAVIEQIANYNNSQINQWEDKIEHNKQLQIDLAAKELELKKNIEQMEVNVSSLGNKLAEYSEITMDINDEIKSTQETIKMLENLGCKDTDDVADFLAKVGDTRFSKPVSRGTITSYFGYRTHPVTGKINSFHGAIDIGGNKEGTSVYSTAAGTVGKIIRKASCGGNSVYIYHRIGGKLYTSSYLHLLDIKVSLGQSVTRETIIGTIGGGSRTPWDGCSTGAHLHFVIANGWYGAICSGDCYLSYSTYIAKAQDPQKILGLPNKGVYWSSR